MAGASGYDDGMKRLSFVLLFALSIGCVGELTVADCPHEEAVASGQSHLEVPTGQVGTGLSCSNCHGVVGTIPKQDLRARRFNDSGCATCHNPNNTAD
jgi:hypothetical protein